MKCYRNSAFVISLNDKGRLMQIDCNILYQTSLLSILLTTNDMNKSKIISFDTMTGKFRYKCQVFHHRSLI